MPYVHLRCELRKWLHNCNNTEIKGKSYIFINILPLVVCLIWHINIKWYWQVIATKSRELTSAVAVFTHPQRINSCVRRKLHIWKIQISAVPMVYYMIQLMQYKAPTLALFGVHVRYSKIYIRVLQEKKLVLTSRPWSQIYGHHLPANIAGSPASLLPIPQAALTMLHVPTMPLFNTQYSIYNKS